MYRRSVFGILGFTPCFEGDGGGGGGQGDDLKKALFERDSANAKLATLQSQLDEMKRLLPSDDERKKWKDLEDQQAKAEEERRRKAGEFDQLKADLVKKHNDEITAMTQRIASLETTILDREVGLLFSNAYVDKVPLFGDEKALTVLPAELAADSLRKFVKVEIKDGKPVSQVINHAGRPVLDPKTGEPMEFGRAMVEVINGLPYKDRILRGSGKAGSGSSGGDGGPTGKVDLANLTPAQMQDPEIRKQAQARTAAAGGVTMGAAFDQMGKK